MALTNMDYSNSPLKGLSWISIFFGAFLFISSFGIYIWFAGVLISGGIVLSEIAPILKRIAPVALSFKSFLYHVIIIILFYFYLKLTHVIELLQDEGTWERITNLFLGITEMR